MKDRQSGINVSIHYGYTIVTGSAGDVVWAKPGQRLRQNIPDPGPFICGSYVTQSALRAGIVFSLFQK
jgi:hypothetical protein